MRSLITAIVVAAGLSACAVGTAFAQNAVPPATEPPVEPATVPNTVPPITTPPVAEPPAALPTVPAEKPKPKPAAKKGPVDALKPGQFVWEKRDVYVNPLRLVVVLDIQRMYVFDGDELVGFTTISSGKKGKETPTGIFTILQKKEYHESNLYANAPMPFMQRLTWDGIALHAGHLPGYPASHGCVRLPKVFAKALYGATQMDGEVVILSSLSAPRPKPKPVEPAAVPPAADTPPPATDPVAPIEPVPTPA
jgi:lipoprotein-anchoring transpeptidase ErfK/SrfK